MENIETTLDNHNDRINQLNETLVTLTALVLEGGGGGGSGSNGGGCDGDAAVGLVLPANGKSKGLCTVPASDNNVVVNGVCTGSDQGSCRAQCRDGVWSYIENTCYQRWTKCGYTNSLHVRWGISCTLSGSSHTGPDVAVGGSCNSDGGSCSAHCNEGGWHRASGNCYDDDDD